MKPSKQMKDLPNKYEDAAAKCMVAAENFKKAIERMREK